GRMHLNNGVGANGTRVLSDSSARLMRVKTGSYPGPTPASFGLGWMFVGGRMVGHGGGGPGIIAWLMIDPQTNGVAAIATNSAEGFSLIADVTEGFMERRGEAPFDAASMQPRNAVDHSKAPAVPFDAALYLGDYDGVTT